MKLLYFLNYQCVKLWFLYKSVCASLAVTQKSSCCLTFPQLLTSAGNEQSLKTPRARTSSQKLFTLNA